RKRPQQFARARRHDRLELRQAFLVQRRPELSIDPHFSGLDRLQPPDGTMFLRVTLANLPNAAQLEQLFDAALDLGDEFNATIQQLALYQISLEQQFTVAGASHSSG